MKTTFLEFEPSICQPGVELRPVVNSHTNILHFHSRGFEGYEEARPNSGFFRTCCLCYITDGRRGSATCALVRALPPALSASALLPGGGRVQA